MTPQRRSVVNDLFTTGAVAIGPPDKPYWYITGRIGLIRARGSLLFTEAGQSQSVAALAATAFGSPALCAPLLTESCQTRLDTLPYYENYVSQSQKLISDLLAPSDYDAIAGSVDNEWNLSLPLAQRLKKPHLLLGEDSAVLTRPDGTGCPLRKLDGMRLLLVCELMASGVRYNRVLQPRIQAIDGRINAVYCLLDRCNGGSDRVIAQGAGCFSLMEFNEEFYTTAQELGFINDAQLAAVLAYQRDPIKTMADFMDSHPDFVNASLQSEDEVVRKCAALCVEKGYYRTKRG